MTRSVGVVIRTLNESEMMERCLTTLRQQRGSFDLDILVVDSGSTDSTVDIARSRGARIVEIAPAEFDYSKALNLGIERVGGEIVVSLSAHAVPIDEHWLERMIRPFSDPMVAGVGARQVPWPDAPWKEATRLRLQFADTSHTHPPATVDMLVFSNAASAIRRSVWRERPFTLPAVEDLDWAQRVLRDGWKIVYAGDAAVYHSHHEPPRAQARRLIDITRAHNLGANRSRWLALREAAGLMYRDCRAILNLDEPSLRKAAYVVESIQTAYYYVVDFSRPGTTAQLRRGAFSRRTRD